MARLTDNNFSENTGLTDNSDQITVNAMGKDTIEVTNSDFIADSTMVRDGQDLILETADGQSVVVQDYFLATPAPSIEAPNGSTLSPALVNSFAQSSPEYAQSSSMTDESPVGAVEEVTGVATVQHADGTSSPISLGMPIYEGDIIETSQTGAVNILFTDETSMAVSENARMSIDDYEFNAEDESGVTNLSVLRGVFVYTSGLIGREDPDDVTIETPVGSIGIRGTIIAGRINPDGESDVTVIEGAIVVKNATGETTLSEQFETVKLTGLNSTIKNIGTLEATDMNDNYGSASSVIPKLFSSINDSANEAQKAEDKLEAEEEKAEEIKIELEAEEAEVQAQVEEKVEVEAQPEEVILQLDPSTVTEKPLRDDLTKEQIQLDNSTVQTAAGTYDVAPDGVKPPAHELQDPNTIISPPQVSNINSLFTRIGDINNDGFMDFLRNTRVDEINNINSNQSNRLVDIIYGGGGGTVTLSAATSTTETGTNSLAFGEEAVGVGDYNGDGIADFAIADSDFDISGAYRGKLYIYSGDDPYNAMATFDGISANEGGNAITTAGDINGDGYSDILVTLDKPINGPGTDFEAFILNGNAVASTNNLIEFTSANRFLDNRCDDSASIGDYNGDGYDDIAISTTDGSQIFTYIIEGGGALTGTIALGGVPDLITPIPAGKNPVNFGIFESGDVNNDGFDDFRYTFGDGSTIKEGEPDTTPINYTGIAAGTGENVIGYTNLLNENGHDDVSLNGVNAPHQTFEISDVTANGEADFRNIDGGKGTDAIRINSDLDFTNINFEQIDQIEELELMDNTATLSIENLFNIMKTSDVKNLHIVGNTGSNLIINGLANSANETDALAQINVGLNADSQDIVDDATLAVIPELLSNGQDFTQYSIGNYNLYIENEVNVSTTA